MRMAVASWMHRSRSLRNAKTLRSRTENKDDAVKLDFNLEPGTLMLEILTYVCQKENVSSIKKLNHLNAFVQLLNKNPNWRSSNVFGFSIEEILCCLRVSLIQDSVQVRAAGLRALRHVINTEEDVLSLNRLHFPYLIARSLDLLLKTDNERVLMSERIQSVKIMRRILFVAPQHFSVTLARPLISVALGPLEETDRLLKACLALLCELCVLNSSVFMECNGVRALLRNAATIPSIHLAEAICGALLFLLNKPLTRKLAKIDLNYLLSGYTNSAVVEMNSFREEERRLTWTNFVLSTLLKSCGGLFELCDYSKTTNGLKSVVNILYLTNHNIRMAILELIFELLNIPQPDWTDDEAVALESVQFTRFRESFKLSEGFLVAEGKYVLSSLSKCRMDLTEVHMSLLLNCFLEAGLPDALVEVIVSSDSILSLRACILLGEFLHLIRKFIPPDCYSIPPALPNLVSYAIRGCPLQSYLNPITENKSAQFTNEPVKQHFQCSHCDEIHHNGKITSNASALRSSWSDVNATENVTKQFIQDNENEDTVTQMFVSSSQKVPDINAEGQQEHDLTILNKNFVDFPPCKRKQRLAMSAVSVMRNLQRQLEKPPAPCSLLLNSVAQYGKPARNTHVDTENDDFEKKIPLKELEELIKDSGVLTSDKAVRWKWESIRIALQLSHYNARIYNDTTFKLFSRRLLNFLKPSSQKFSHTPVKYEYVVVNIYTLVVCELIDVLLDSNYTDGVKLLEEFLEDLDDQLKQVMEVKSVHDCLLSPQRLTNSLSQDYFLLIGRLSNSETGLSLLQKSNVFDRLYHIAVSMNLDCYVKLIVSCLSYVSSEMTRKLLAGVLSSTYLSSRLYATKFLHVLLRTKASMHESFRNWLAEMLVNQLYDENQAISMVALDALNEAVDDKDYLEALVSLRPSLLHLGDVGLLLLIRFLSSEKGFTYLLAANFIAPQLQRWASFFNRKYTSIVEGELHDALSQYQRGDDGRYRQRITGNRAIVKKVYVPPHLYGQLVQHRQGFNLLLKHENIHRMIWIISSAQYDTDENIMELKSALWAMGHFATSSAGVKYLTECGIIKAIVQIAENASVYSIKATAFYVLSLIATTKEGTMALNRNGWKCLKRNRHDWCFVSENKFDPFSISSFDNAYEDDDVDAAASPINFEQCQNNFNNSLGHVSDSETTNFSNKFNFEQKSATLPERGNVNQVLHNRSFSESKAEASDKWSSSESPLCNFRKYMSDLSCATDSSTSGISSSDSVPSRLPNLNEKISTLSPIPSSNSLTTLPTVCNAKEQGRLFSAKRNHSVSFNQRLSFNGSFGYKTLRMLQTRHQRPSFSASATMEYLSVYDRREMSPLIRPKFPRYLHKSSMNESVSDSPVFQIDRNQSNISSTMGSGRFSHSTEIEDVKSEIDGPVYQGVSLPWRLRCFLKRASKEAENTKDGSRVDSLANLEEDQIRQDNDQSKMLNTTGKWHRHDTATCLLCSTKRKLADQNNERPRKTSACSLHRMRTETESSYGGGFGPESESPVFMTWQQKPVGLADDTPGGVTSSTLEISETQNSSIASGTEHCLKSRSILRYEVLLLIEQLGNPISFKSCKQGLLQLKQICGDLFQDVCLFSDVSCLLGNINYRIHARQLIQDLFLDAPFCELYDEVAIILSRFSTSNEDRNAVSNDSATSANQLLSKNGVVGVESFCDEFKVSQPINGNLEMIAETDASDTKRAETATADHDCAVSDEKFKQRRNSKQESSIVQVQDGQKQQSRACVKNTEEIFDFRRAYSYPATNHTTAGLTFYDLTRNSYAYSCNVPSGRSHSVSATCSYISEISLMPHPKFLAKASEVTVDSSLIASAATAANNAILDSGYDTKRSLLSLKNKSSVLLTLENQFSLLDLTPTTEIIVRDD